ncbi:sortase domain-containing protein [Senegalimassilia anaerobia]
MRKYVKTFIVFLLLAIIVVFTGMVGIRLYELHRSNSVIQELRSEIKAQETEPAHEVEGSAEISEAEPETMFPSFLQAENDDLAAWVTIPGTEIDYPVMLTPQNMEYYLSRDFRKNPSEYGTPFFDTRSAPLLTADSLLIYGHNMKDGTMFSELSKYTEEAFGAAHATITLSFPEETRTYQLFSVLQISTDNDEEWSYYNCVGSLDAAQFETYVQTFREKALYSTEVQPRAGDQLLILSTCAYHAHNGRLLVVGCRVS